MENNKNMCPFEAFGSMSPIMSTSHMKNGHGAVRMFKGVGCALCPHKYEIDDMFWHNENN